LTGHEVDGRFPGQPPGGTTAVFVRVKRLCALAPSFQSRRSSIRLCSNHAHPNHLPRRSVACPTFAASMCPSAPRARKVLRGQVLEVSRRCSPALLPRERVLAASKRQLRIVEELPSRASYPFDLCAKPPALRRPLKLLGPRPTRKGSSNQPTMPIKALARGSGRCLRPEKRRFSTGLFSSAC